MKLITVQFDESVNINSIPKGATVTVSDGTTTLTGKVMALTDMADPEAVLVPHTHPVTGAAGLPVTPP